VIVASHFGHCMIFRFK